MNSQIPGLIADIRREQQQTQKLVQELEELLSDLSGDPDSVDLRAIASILHDFYTGIEKIFSRIALEMEGNLPEGENWHRQLLERMAVDIKKVRPAVISEELEVKLDEYLRFRHLFRHSYGFLLQWEKCKGLTNNLTPCHKQVQKELKVFLTFLTKLQEEISNSDF